MDIKKIQYEKGLRNTDYYTQYICFMYHIRTIKHPIHTKSILYTITHINLQTYQRTGRV